MNLYESGENYLETILILTKRNGSVRSIDIANELNYSKPSISRAMSLFKKEGLIVMHDDGQIELTESGLKKAQGVYERHRYITEFLVDSLKVDETIAEQDACRIEHILSAESFAKIKDYVNQLRINS
jgi:Mn-dependent DtxR family transcriptional regulator